MASVSGVSSSNVSSIYGSRNVLSGLASGMDTESMIENAISGYQLKISGLQQKQTKLTWKQEAYRGLTDKLVAFSQKYTSYSSATNLFSTSFFNNAMITSTNGVNKDYVSATGKTSSNVQINGVAQLATAGRYQVSGNTGVLASVAQGANGSRSVQASRSVSLNGETFTSNLAGNMTIKYGTQSVSLNFAEDEIFESAQDFVDAINDKLKDVDITYTGGNKESADKAISATLVNGVITFTDAKSAGNEVYINNVSGSLATTFKESSFNATNKISSLDLSGKTLKTAVKVMDQIAGKTMTFNLDGTSKQITLPDAAELDAYMTSNSQYNSREEALTGYIQDKLTRAFGANKIAVDNLDTEGGLKLSFTIKSGSSLTVASTANNALGLDASATTSLNTGKTLGELLGANLNGLSGGVLEATGSVIKQTNGTYLDAAGNLCNAQGQRLGSDGELLQGYDLVINGEKIGTYTRDTALETVLLDINKNTDAGVSVSYSKTTNQFVFNTGETGDGFGVEYSGGLAEKIFGKFDEANYTKGQDAIINMTVNGSNMTISRSTNTFDVDGLSVTVNGTFNGSMVDGTAAGDAVFDFMDGQKNIDVNEIKNAVTFTTQSDAGKIVDAVKSMITDINDIMTSLRAAYNTLPAQKSNGGKYEPLTDSDKDSMTETAISNYEEKARQGRLFGDSDLSSLYSKLLAAITPSGTDGADLRSMGITTSYISGVTTLNLDENKLRDMLSTNPDKVRDAFTKVKGDGSSTNGVMQNLKTQLDAYASVQGTKGILINKAGSKYSALSLLNNSIQKQLESYDTQIEKWQNQMSNKVDYYTRQFTRLEQLISEMNSQSSAIAGFMGQ